MTLHTTARALLVILDAFRFVFRKTFRMNYAYRQHDQRMETSVAGLRSWYAALDQDLRRSLRQELRALLAGLNLPMPAPPQAELALAGQA